MGRTNRRRDRWLKRGLELALRPFFSRSAVDLSRIRASRPRRVLFVRQHNQMGDMLCATPAFAAVRSAFPGCRTLLVTAPVNDGVVRNNPDLDAILLFDKVRLRRSPRAALRFLRTLRAFEADVAVVLNSVSFSSTSAWLAVLSGARFIVGGSSEAFGWSFSRWLYDLEMPSRKELAGHAIDHGLDGLRAVGFEVGSRLPVLRPGPRARRDARRFLEGLGPGPYFALHPGAGKEANRWPPDRFAAMAREQEEQGLRSFLIEGPADGPATRQTLEALGESRPVLRGVGVETVAAVLERCDLALVNDTGVMHVAGAVGTPTVALFGPTPSEGWKPPSADLVALQSPDGSMEGLSETVVRDALRRRRRSVRGSAQSSEASSEGDALPVKRSR